MTQYAFFVNSDACSGCKTCQVACKDRHDIRAGVHWRRVYEVTSGGWLKKDGAWVSSVLAYNLSASCHHCVTPVCGRQCSAEAIWKRPDGIVLIDESSCTRCRKCQADCPYGAIAWDAPANIVKKCDFCVEDVDAGLAPACVAACPNRALEFGEFEELRARPGTTRRVFPMTDPAISEPAVVIRPHRNAAAVQSREPQVVNWEEL
jgi:anaerobic dimethyl sulfoxide reductase subunit B (iron-sulfur subunit)